MTTRWITGLVTRATAATLGALAALGALARPAAASPLTDALARHADADVAALRTAHDQPAARCTLGAIYARRNDLPRAALYLADCEHLALPDDLAGAIGQTVRDVKRRLDASQLARLDIVTRPEGLIADIDALPGEAFATPATVWVMPGPHIVHVEGGEQAWKQRIIAEPHKNAVVMFETGLDARPPAPRTQTIDLADGSDGSLGEEHTGPPPPVKRPSLIQGKYAGVADPAAEGPIDDPFAPLAERTGPATLRTSWLGVRLGAGMFDDSAATARSGVAVAVAGRLRLTDAGFVAIRADWSRRGGDVMTGTSPNGGPNNGPNDGPIGGPNGGPIDVLGASAGLGVTVLGDPRSTDGFALAVLGQLRGDLRLATTRGDAPVHRTGLGVAAGAELALPRAPLTVGVRVEQGVTALVSGARDRAVLLELGVDLR
ncbi:MAG TPA: hypothetical protein VH165_10555 [Kofleriaceae bacterium]|nr:hypothetical protein [Kofleriaceae bacterium]